MQNKSSEYNIVLLLGANSGDRIQSLSDGLKWLSNKLQNFRSSIIYETPAYVSNSSGNIIKEDDSTYMNSVAVGMYHGNLEHLIREIKKYEIDHGRDDVARSLGEVPIDIDIVYCNGKLLRHSDSNASYFKIGYKLLSEYNIGL